MISKNSKLLNWIFFILIGLNIISFFNIYTYKIYDKFSTIGNLLILFVLFLAKTKITKSEFKTILYVIAFFIYSLSTLLITEGGIGSVLVPLIGVFVILVSNRWKVDRLVIKLFFLLMLILNLFWVYNSPGYYYAYLFNKSSYLNSNTVGMLLTLTTIYLIIISKLVFTKSYKIFNLILLVLNFWALYNVQSRNSIMGLVVFLFLNYLVPKKIFRNRKKILFMYLLIIVLGVLIPYFFTQMYINGVDLRIPFVNKSLYTGREIIWSNYYNALANNNFALFWGLGSKVKLWEGESLNAHNNYLAMVINFGFIGFIMYFGFYFNQLKKIISNDISNIQLSLLIGFLTVLFIGYFEVNLLWSNLAYLNLLFLGMKVDNFT